LLETLGGQGEGTAGAEQSDMVRNQ